MERPAPVIFLNICHQLDLDVKDQKQINKEYERFANYKHWPEQAKLFMPVYGGVSLFIVLSLALTKVVVEIDFCTFQSWPFFQMLSNSRFVIDSQGLLEEEMPYYELAMCSIPVIYIPVKLVALSGLILGLIGGVKNALNLPEEHFIFRKAYTTYSMSVLFILFLFGLVFAGAGDGDYRMTRVFGLDMLGRSYYFYVFFYIAIHIVGCNHVLFHTAYYFSARFTKFIRSY